MQQFTGGRFILGLGTGHREGNSALGIEMGQPMTKMRETVTTLRKMLDGGGTGPRISGKLPLYLAGVSRPMVRMAGEIADGVIFNFFPPARVQARRWAKSLRAPARPGATRPRSSRRCSRPRSSPTTWKRRAVRRARCSRVTARCGFTAT